MKTEKEVKMQLEAMINDLENMREEWIKSNKSEKLEIDLLQHEINTLKWVLE